MSQSDAALALMDRALEKARSALLHSHPNPAVGCVIVDDQGQVLGEGCTQPPGSAHAEIMALRQAQAAGKDVRGSTVYVTLEPCSHHGRTGPCCDALIAAQVKSVVAAVEDPNPLVHGAGLARLRAAGISVELGLRAEQAVELNVGFFSRMVRRRPWVRLKSAASLDGRTALPNGASQWITSERSRADTHAWRARSNAILTGIGTVLSDDPLLTARAPGVTQQPALAILDSNLRTQPQARLWQAQGRSIYIYTASSLESPQACALTRCGAQVLSCPQACGGLDLEHVLADLARREVGQLHIEAGATLSGAWLEAGLVDELLLYMAPILLGAGPGVAQMAAPLSLGDAPRWRMIDVERLGEDLRIVARRTDLPGLRTG